jgi:hypothetical protein
MKLALHWHISQSPSSMFSPALLGSQMLDRAVADLFLEGSEGGCHTAGRLHFLLVRFSFVFMDKILLFFG